jgi:hypothetical protein
LRKVGLDNNSVSDHQGIIMKKRESREKTGFSAPWLRNGSLHLLSSSSFNRIDRVKLKLIGQVYRPEDILES